jgi:hypothetical protein
MTRADIAASMDAALAWLVSRDSPESIIAAHEAGIATDPRDAQRWVSRVLADQDAGGAWRGDLTATAHALMDVMEIRAAATLQEQDPGIGRALDWIRARRGVPGAWTDGCTPPRHRQGTCHHFLGGFFSPAPPEVVLESGALRSGVAATGDSPARFIASLAALQCLLAWQRDTADIRLHLEGVRRVASLWPAAPPPDLTLACFLAAVRVLLHSPVEEDQQEARRGVLLVSGKQRGDGSWVDIDPIQALELFGEASELGVAREQARGALRHGARLLQTTQSDNGSWGGEAPERRALIAWRTLRRVSLLPQA